MSAESSSIHADDDNNSSPTVFRTPSPPQDDELRWTALHPSHTTGDLPKTATTADEEEARSDRGEQEGLEFSWAAVEELVTTHDLCATGPALALALADGDSAIGRYLRSFHPSGMYIPGIIDFAFLFF